MDSPGKNAAAIVVFFIPPILINILNVRKYGEVEFWMTTIKLTTILGLIILGVVIAAGGISSLLLGTDANYRPVPCDKNDIAIGSCLSKPGFGCSSVEIKS